MRLDLKQLLFLVVVRLVLLRFFSARCSYSVRPRRHRNDPAVILPRKESIRLQSSSDSSDNFASELALEPLIKCEGPTSLRLLPIRVNSLLPRKGSFECLRLSG